MRPYNCKTFEDVCSLRRDNKDAGGFWIMTDGNVVTICQQKFGERSTATVNVPRKDFNRLVAWYMSEQERFKKRKRRQ